MVNDNKNFKDKNNYEENILYTYMQNSIFSLFNDNNNIDNKNKLIITETNKSFILRTLN